MTIASVSDQNSTAVRYLRFTYIALLISLIGLSYAFEQTQGLVYGTDGQRLLYAADFDSHSNDDAAILAGLFFFPVPLAFRVLRWRKRIAVLEVLVLGVLWMLAFVLLFSMETASIWRTIVSGHNVLLLLWLIVFAGLLPVQLVLVSVERPGFYS